MLPDPIFKSILQTVEDAQLEGRIHSHAEALRLVEEQFPLKPIVILAPMA